MVKRLRPFIWCLLAAALRGQTVQWDPPGGTLSVGRTTEFDLVCRDCQMRSRPQPPQIPGFVIRYVRTTAGYDISGIPVTTYVFWGYWSKMEDLILPSFAAPTDHGLVTVAEARFEPVAATLGTNKQSLASAVAATLIVPADVWQGQVFPVHFVIDADATYQPDWSHSAPTWTHAGVDVEEWAPPQAHDSPGAGGGRSGLEYDTRGVALEAGSVQLQPDREFVSLNVGVAAFGPATPQYAQFSVPCDPATIVVKPLPAPPAGFLGGVGHFAIAAHLAPAAAAPGEPVTWTVELSGQGNWTQIKAMPARDVPDAFKVVHPQIQKNLEPGKLFNATFTEDLVLVASKAGHFVLPPVRWVYFDPDSGTYQSVSTPPAPIDVSGAAVNSESSAPAETKRLPAEILPLGDVTALPLPRPARLLAAAAPYLVLFAGWLGLAVRLARRGDAGNARRQAWSRQRARLLRIQAAAQSNDAPALRHLLLQWQHDAVATWSLPQASPTPESIADRAEGALWAEADAAIYGLSPKLPEDWLVRADQSLAELPPPPFRWSSALAPRHLFPFVALLAASLSLGAADSSVSDAAADFSAGHYAQAEAAWRAAPAADAAAKLDVSIALAQQGRWGEAVPFAAEAFVRDPAPLRIRAQFTATCDRASVDPGPLTRFLVPDAWSRLVESASPAVWQRAVIAAAWLGALGLALLLLKGYRVLPARWPALVGLLLVTGALAGGSVAAAAAGSYGAAGDADALWVLRPTVMRSIPTEVAGVQASTNVPPGAIGVPDRHFLNWTRLRFDDGSTGWIRRSELTPLWR